MKAAGASSDGLLEWLEANLEWFDPERWARYLPVRRFPGTPVLELLSVLRALRRGPRANDVERLVPPVLELAEAVAGSASFDARMRRADDSFAYHVWLLALIEELGGCAESGRAQARRLLEVGAGDVAGRYRPPAGALELGYVLELAGIDAGLPRTAELYRRCAPHFSADPVHLTDGDAYGITHILFYATDFGAQRPDGPDRGRTVLRLLGTYLAEADFDLSAELLFCGRILGLDGHRFVEHGHRSLAAAQHTDGAMPSRLFDPVTAAGATGERARAYVFGTCYHPTIAAALAVAGGGPG
ncbi:hypothetical protein J0910_11840 [Nocardiopsis sp. CNT-189]|uniref:DUF6895 family protein n=1 Tax=Nocardiopsis oceanisediminis TaxID=2816862 RepID=UPI003B395B0D